MPFKQQIKIINQLVSETASTKNNLMVIAVSINKVTPKADTRRDD